jgi:MscS family membrane protein
LPAKTAANYLAAAVFFGLLLLSNIASAADANPLRPADRSSPRATLSLFVSSVDDVYKGAIDIIRDYAASDRLYMTADERRRMFENRYRALPAVQSLDTSHLFPAVQQIVSIERAIQLKEILDRIGVPSLDTVPDRDEMARTGAKRWRIPDTEIDLVLMESRPHQGEYLVSADTVDRLPEFYERVHDLPYLPGPAQQLSDIYRSVSGNHAATIYEINANSPAGLDRIVPTRWMVSLPPWLKARVVDVAIWQWLGLAFGLLVSALIIFAAYRVALRFKRRRGDNVTGPGWYSLLTPLAIVIVAQGLIPILCLILRIGSNPRVVIAVGQTVAEFAGTAWIAVIGAGLLGETIARSEHLARSSLDSQLIRLSARFLGILVAVGLLMQGATELGFPAYSVLAGLGVGGLAIALAARDSLANFLGSVLIMFEKPFRVGHLIRVSGSEGTVEEVGFRSTRIRTADNSLISLPNNTVVNATVENLSLRAMRRQRMIVQLSCDASSEQMNEFTQGIEQILTDHPLTKKDNFHVRFNDFGENSLNFLVVFFLEVSTYADELREREQILYDIMALTQKIGVEFASSTRPLQVEIMPKSAAGVVEASMVDAAANTEAPPPRAANVPERERSAQTAD